jgi:hypothetical protein
VQGDGTSYFLTSAAFPQAVAANGLSVFGWVFLPSTSSAAGEIVNRQDSGTDRVCLIRHASNGGFLANFYTAGGTLIASADPSFDLDGGAWHHFVGWWEPGNQDAWAAVDDGTPVSAAGAADIDESVAQGWALLATDAGATPLRSGSRIAKVGIYDGVLTSGQRTSLFSGAF